MRNALPPGTDQRTATDELANETDAMAKAATGAQTAPRPAGTTATATVQLPLKSSRSTTAK